MTFNQFFQKYDGKKIDYDGRYGVQCVDLINKYIEDVLNLKLEYFPKYAKQFWTERNSVKWLADNFNFISPKAEFKKGDIGVRTSGTAGHVFIIVANAKAEDSQFWMIDQNGGGNGEGVTLRVKVKNTTNVNGVLRPKKGGGKIKLFESPNSQFKTNAYLTEFSFVYSDNKKQKKIGCVNEFEKVKLLASGNENAIIQYGVDKNTYKVGLVSTNLIKKI